MFQSREVTTQYDDMHHIDNILDDDDYDSSDIQRSILEEFENSYESANEVKQLRTELEKTKKELYYLRKKYEEKNKDINMLVTVLSHSLQNKQNIYDKMQKIAEIVNEVSLDYHTTCRSFRNKDSQSDQSKPFIREAGIWNENLCKKSNRSFDNVDKTQLNDVKRELFSMSNNGSSVEDPSITEYNDEFAEYYDQFNFETFETPVKADRHDYNLWWGTPPERPVRQSNRAYADDDIDWRNHVNEMEPICESMLSQYYSGPTTPEERV